MHKRIGSAFGLARPWPCSGQVYRRNSRLCGKRLTAGTNQRMKPIALRADRRRRLVGRLCSLHAVTLHRLDELDGLQNVLYAGHHCPLNPLAKRTGRSFRWAFARGSEHQFVESLVLLPW